MGNQVARRAVGPGHDVNGGAVRHEASSNHRPNPAPAARDYAVLSSQVVQRAAVQPLSGSLKLSLQKVPRRLRPHFLSLELPQI